MPDAPDGFRYQPYSQRAVLGDMGELAVRLGSPIVYDRRGTVIWYDTVAYGLTPWTESGAGTGNASQVILGGGSFGPYLIEQTSGSDGDRWRQMWHPMPLTVINKWGLSVSFAVTDDFDYLSFSLNKYDGSERMQARIKITLSGLLLQYRDSAGNEQTIATIDNPVYTYHTFHWIKLVADYENGVYTRVIYDDIEYDLSDYDLYVAAAADVPQSRPYITVRGRSGENDKILVSAVILTIDEP